MAKNDENAPQDPKAQKAQEDALGTDKGFTGIKVDPRPNEEYSLESGPDSPSAADVRGDLDRSAE